MFNFSKESISLLDILIMNEKSPMDGLIFETKINLDDSSVNSETTFIQILLKKVIYKQKSATMVILRNVNNIIRYQKKKNEQKYQSLLTATFSHEMLTPLNSIINISQSLLKKLSPSLQTYQSVVINSAKNLQFMIESLLDLMLLQKGTFSLNPNYFVPSSAVSKIIEQVEL